MDICVGKKIVDTVALRLRDRGVGKITLMNEERAYLE